MAVHSGKLGVVNGVAGVKDWAVTVLSRVSDYGASNTKNGRVRPIGVKDWNGRFNFVGVIPPAMPGESFSWQGYDGADLSSGTAIIDSVELFCDIENAREIVGTCNFSGNGAHTFGIGTATDVTTTSPYPALGCKANYAGTDIPDVRNWRLTISANNRPYVSSDTANWTKRVAGMIDAQAMVSMYVTTLAGLPAMNAYDILKLYVDATTYWSLKWMMGTNVAPYANVDSADAVGANLIFQFSGLDDADTAGSIVKPDLVVWWP